jgi:hypothetical protein
MASKLHAFIQALAKRTEERKLNWEPTPDEDFYQVSFSEYVVKVWHRPTRMTSATGEDYCLGIYNKDGTLIDTADDVSLGEDGFNDAYNFLKRLHDGARRSAMGVDKALDSLISALGELEAEPPIRPTDEPPF